MDEFRRIIEAILSGEIDSASKLDAAKREAGTRMGLSHFIRNSEILSVASQAERKRVLPMLQKKPTRTMSGVAIVAAMTAPSECPHGKCKYCPGGVDLDVPQSYTGKEPAARRAIQHGFDPYMQVTMRLNQLSSIGHPVDKVELIVMGGTLTAQMLDYQEWFVKGCLRAMNDFDDNQKRIGDVGEEAFMSHASPLPFAYMEDVQKANETASVRCVGITFEPRPDWAKKEQIDQMLSFGVTRVEMGVQNPDDSVYERIERGHTVADVAEATQQLRDSAFKVSYHLMPGLSGYDPDGDLAIFETVFSDERFMPDMIKIYPCIVMGGTEFSAMMHRGEFTPMTTDEAVHVIAKAKAMLPKWVRTMRIMRDIPSNIVEAGIKNSNLGQLVYEHMEREGLSCQCIRCREVGRAIARGMEPVEDDIKLLRTDYIASGGREVFLSFEDVDQDMLIGFVRLRLPFSPHRPEIDVNTGLIRELHVYGPQLMLGQTPEFEWQHRGYGQELLREAERIARDEYDMEKMAIISGIGAREYYGRLGYRRDGPYMSSKLG